MLSVMMGDLDHRRLFSLTPNGSLESDIIITDRLMTQSVLTLLSYSTVLSLRPCELPLPRRAPLIGLCPTVKLPGSLDHCQKKTTSDVLAVVSPRYNRNHGPDAAPGDPGRFEP